MNVSIPGADLTVSALCLGTGSFGTAISKGDAFALLDRFAELGGNFLDTANIYGNWVKEVEPSISEKVIGAWLEARKNRETIVIGTKGGHFDLDRKEVCRVTPADIVQDLDQSLASLGVDTVDLYWLHRDNPALPVETLVDVLDAQQRAGKIRWYGTSNWKPQRIAAANRYAAQTGKFEFIADQVLWNAAPLDRQPYGDPTVDFMSEERYAAHLESGMAEMPYQSQAGGLYQRIDAGREESISAGLRSMYRMDEGRERYRRMREIMRETGLTVTQVALGYLRGQPFPTIPIIGSRNLEQLEDSMSALDVALTPEQIARIGPPAYRLGEQMGVTSV